MKRAFWSLSLSAMLTAALALPASAGGGNAAPSGPHYNLNIIGVDNPKNSPMTGSDRHTIFVALGTKKPDDPVRTDIWLTQGEFQVCDGNGFDGAYDCAGNQVGRGLNGAVFQLPSASYQVWGRALGEPHGSAVITTCAYDETGLRICSTENTVDVFSRGHGKQSFQNVTSKLTTMNACFDPIDGIAGNVVCATVSLFNSALEDFLWQYDNNGLRLAQIRFYLNQ